MIIEALLNRRICVLDILRPKFISAVKSAELFKSAAEKCSLKEVTFGRGLRLKHANRIPRLKVGVSVGVKLREDNSDAIEIPPELNWLSHRDHVFAIKIFVSKHAYAPNIVCEKR